MYTNSTIGKGSWKLPDIIAYYSKTKGSFDNVDKMLSCYSYKRKANIWPIVVFYNIINLSALNAYPIYEELNPS